MIITITGWPGTNTRNVCKILALQLGLKYLTEEKIKEDVAKEHNILVEELDFKLGKEAFINAVNGIFRKQGSENVITDYALASWLVNDAALKVFLESKENNRVKKMVVSREMPLIVAKQMIKNEEDERKKKYLYEYGINIFDMQNFDIVLNTDKLNEDGIIALIKKYLEKMKK
ncbi:MAG: cytidylate kinase family protein [archaeon]